MDVEADYLRALTISQTAKLIGVSPKKIRSWITEGTLRAVILPDGRKRILRRDLEGFFEQRYVAAQTPGGSGESRRRGKYV